jgi:methylase of polypeptide subunit release factors
MASSDSGNGHDHKRTVREEFTKQADAYATSPAITDQERLGRLVEAVNPSGNKRGIEIATGPGYVAMALAARCREVVGVDLTEAPLKIAERTRAGHCKYQFSVRRCRAPTFC